MEITEVRDKILKFLHFKNIYNLPPKYNENFFEGIDILKGSITKAMVQNDYVTFYQFVIYNNGVEVGTIKKRFS